MAEDVIPEKTKALVELYKVVEKDLPDNEKKEKIVKALVKQGISKPRAVELADQVMKEHEEMKPTPEEEEWFQQTCEFVENSLAEGKPKEEIVEELIKMDLV
jgi:MoaA/NifB/PqqE/SkfB family radical SAM enzyme